MIEYRLKDGSTKFVYPQHVGQFELDFPNALRVGGPSPLQPLDTLQVLDSFLVNTDNTQLGVEEQAAIEKKEASPWYQLGKSLKKHDEFK